MKKEVDETSNVLKSAAKMSIGTLSSRLLGLLRDVLMAASFSIFTTDAWLVAYRIPNLFRRLFGEGALSVSFIPLLIEERERRGEEAEKKLVSSVFSLLFSLLAVSSLLCFVFAEPIINSIAGGEAFSSVPGKLEASSRFLRIMSFFLLSICLFAFFMALLNSRKKFFLAAFAPVVLNICLVVACFVPENFEKISGDSLSFAALIGGALQMLILIPAVVKLGLFPSWANPFNRNSSVWKVVRNTIPALLSMGILQITTMVNVYFATTIESGANSWLYYADRILELPLSLIGVSFATALLPSLSQDWVNSNLDKFRKSMEEQMALVWFLAIPAAMGIYFLSLPMVEIMFMHGKFDAYSATRTAQILEVYAFSLLVYVSIRVFNVSFYAIQKPWLPIFGTCASLVSHLIMVNYWTDSFGVRGLALSTALSGAVGWFLMLVVYRRQVGSLSFSNLSLKVLKFSLASFSMYFVLKVYLDARLTQNWPILLDTLLLLVSISISAGLYFLLTNLMGCSESKRISSKILRRFRRA